MYLSAVLIHHSLQADLSSARLKCVKLTHEVAALSSETSYKKKIAELREASPSPQDSRIAKLSSITVYGVPLNSHSPASAIAADIVASLRRGNVAVDSTSLASAIFASLEADSVSAGIVPSPTIERSLGILNAQLQERLYNQRSIEGVLQCCSYAQSYAKGAIDECWLASTLLSVCTLCTKGCITNVPFHDFVVSLCRNLASLACNCDPRSVSVMRTIAAVASFLQMPLLLYDCFCAAFNSSSHVNVIPSLLFHAARIWLAPFSQTTGASSSLLALFIACMFDPSTQLSFSESEAAHAVAFLFTVCSSCDSFSHVAQVVPCCISKMAGTGADEAFIACKFAVSILDTSSIWSSVAFPILSMLHRHFAQLSSGQEPPIDFSACYSESLNALLDHQCCPVTIENTAFSILLLGHAISAIIQQSEHCLNKCLLLISPAVGFLFKICSRNVQFSLKKVKLSSSMTNSSPEAAVYSLSELINVACTVSCYSSDESDFESIDSIESLWKKLLLLVSVDTSGDDGSALPLSKRSRGLASFVPD